MILLDTHALIWWIEESGRLSDAAAEAIRVRGPALVSPISFWELAVLLERGRVSIDQELPRWCRDFLATSMAEVAALIPSTAISAARLPEFRGDLADRFIYATARELDIALVSKDTRFTEYARRRGEVEVIW